MKSQKKTSSEFLETVRLTVNEHQMLRRGASVLIGVSGGPDSLALWLALVALRGEFNLKLQVAYVDHGLRPTAVRREIQLVQELGRLWKVPVRILKRSVQAKGGVSLEAAARTARHEALTRLAIRTGSSCVALGHTQDDQAETVLMWLIRGAGTRGLTGIPPVRSLRANRRTPKLIRPLIESSRASVETFLKSHSVCPLQDRSNQSKRFLRNRIRKELIPLVEQQYNKQLKRHLAGLAQILREDLDWLDAESAQWFGKVTRLQSRGIRLDREQLREVPAALRRAILQRCVRRLQGDGQGFAKGHWKALEQLLIGPNGGALDLPHGFRAQSVNAQWLLLSCRKSLKR